MEKVLVIAAHPDDEVLGLGGTIAKYASRGDRVALLIVTDGSTSQYRNASNLNEIINKKRTEINNCAMILGIEKVFYGELPDMKLDTVSHIDLNQVIEKAISDYQPSIVFTHFAGDINLDHQLISRSTVVACRPTSSQCVKKLLFYSVPSSTEWNYQSSDNAFHPNWYEDISGESAEKKYKAMDCYQTELRQYPHPRSVDYLKKADAIEGNKVGLMAAESFVLVRNIE